LQVNLTASLHKAWLFRGSDRSGQRTAIIYTLIQTAKLKNVAPQAWLAGALSRIVDRGSPHQQA
jgi:hypothetical protein